MLTGGPFVKVIVSVPGQTPQTVSQQLERLEAFCAAMGVPVEYAAADRNGTAQPPSQRLPQAPPRKPGRPRKTIQVDRLRNLLLDRNGTGWRKLCERYNAGLRPDEQVSFILLRRVAKQLQFESR